MNLTLKPSIHRSRLAIGLLFLAVFPVWTALGQCGSAIIQNKSSSSSKGKCGWTECSGQESTPPKYYLVNTYAHSISVTTLMYNIRPSVEYDQKGSLIEKNVQTTDPISCSSSNCWSGTESLAGNSYDSGGAHPYGFSGAITNSSTGDWDTNKISGGYPPWWDPYVSTTTNYTSTTCGTEVSGSHTWTDGDPGQFDLMEKTINGLSEEYTDAKLRGILIASLPPYPSDWANGSGTASYSLSADHTTATGGKMKYRFFMCGMKNVKGTSYKIEWDEITTSDSNPPTIEHKSETCSGNGDPNGTYSSEHEVDVPETPCSKTEANATLTEVPSSSPGSGGN